MPLDESQYHTLADELLEKLFDELDEAIGDVADIDLQDGILNIEFDAGGVYIINKNAINREIWMASPKSGASHYAYVEGAWTGTRDQADFLARLGDELKVSLS
ncbi:Protein CyaY [Candidatus Terasakiella magnetica]|uniref:Protein CyaY n=2 Tax=Candidatus Terasakiella magnetica TaxID=1867952 RepID=A0A1C3RHT7_9PROT|nr:Protein CyaY [Candidatus Terasakiella magnetica]